MAVQKMTIAKALNAGLRAAMEKDPRSSSRVRTWANSVGFSDHRTPAEGLRRGRVIDTPLAESGILGTAIGMALRAIGQWSRSSSGWLRLPGLRPDRVAAGQAPLPPRGVRSRCRWSCASRWVAASAPSSTTVSPMRPTSPIPSASGRLLLEPTDAYWMIQQAIETDDPVIFYEPKRRYHEKGEIDVDVPPARDLFSANVVRQGTDATVACYGPMVRTCLDAAKVAEEEGRSLEVIDLRSVSPLDIDTLTTSVTRTGRLVVVTEAHSFRGPERGDRGGRDRALLLQPGGAGHPGHRLERALPAVQDRGAFPAGPRPGARRRRPCPGPLRRQPHDPREFKLPDPGEGLLEPRSSSGRSPSATPSRSTTSSSRSRPPSRSWSCRSRGPAP